MNMLNIGFYFTVFYYLLFFDHLYLLYYQKFIMEADKLEKKPRKKNHVAQKPVYTNMNAFKTQQKYYKFYKGYQTDFSKVYNPQKQNCKYIKGYQVYELACQGAYLIKKFNSQKVVNQIAMLALNVYCKKPYRTNLDARQDLYKQKNQTSQNMENQIEQQIGKQQLQQNNNFLVQDKVNQLQKQYQNNNQSVEKQQGSNLKKQQIQNIKKVKNKQTQSGKKYFFNDSIRWANIGYQYDWTLRKYPNYNTIMHQSIKQLCQRANALYEAILDKDYGYVPESVIVNYYNDRDYMTGHLDDAQIDQQSPIYSFSLGLSCIFLIGGPSKDDKPIVIRLDSGDLFIMSSKARKCYHGVPRVLKQTYQQQIPILSYSQFQNNSINAHNYLSTHRININARQVFPK